jgi:hypothetical protein
VRSADGNSLDHLVGAQQQRRRSSVAARSSARSSGRLSLEGFSETGRRARHRQAVVVAPFARGSPDLRLDWSGARQQSRDCFANLVEQ